MNLDPSFIASGSSTCKSLMRTKPPAYRCLLKSIKTHLLCLYASHMMKGMRRTI